jgi:hypothetical protein
MSSFGFDVDYVGIDVDAGDDDDNGATSTIMSWSTFIVEGCSVKVPF